MWGEREGGGALVVAQENEGVAGSVAEEDELEVGAHGGDAVVLPGEMELLK